MSNERINSGEARAIMMLFIMGSTMIMGAAGNARNDAWIAVLLAMVISVPALLIYARLLALYPGKNLFDICLQVFGKWAGRVLILFYVWYAIHLAALVIRNYGEFMESEAAPETPMLVPMLLVALICIFGVMKGIETIGRSARLLLNVCLATIIVVITLTIGRVELDNLLPILDRGWMPVWAGAFHTFSFPFAETILLTAIFSNVKDGKSFVHIFMYGLLFSGIMIAYIPFRNICVLGPYIMSNVYFPSYAAVGRLHAGDFIQRIEGTVAIIFVICVYIKVSVCLLAASQGIAKLFGLQSYRSVVVQLGLLTTYLAYSLYDNIMEMMDFATKIYPFYALPFQVIFPILLLLGAEIKRRWRTPAKSG